MKRTRKAPFATDYYFEGFYIFMKDGMVNNWQTKIAVVKFITIISWFKTGI